MNLSPQTHSSEEPEQQPALPSSEETLIQTTPTSDSVTDETELQPVQPVSEDIPTQPASSSESAEETELQPVQPVSDDIPVLPSESSAEETELQPGTFSDPNENEDAELAEDEDSEDEPGIFIHREVLIAVAGALVVIALLVVFLVVVNRPKDPPTGWIANYTPAAGTSSASKLLYYLHWTNQDGALTGQFQIAADVSGKVQLATGPATGLYSRDNHIIYVVITLGGQASTLTGKINDANDTLTLNQPGGSSSSQFVFHIGSAGDYKQDTNKLTK